MVRPLLVVPPMKIAPVASTDTAAALDSFVARSACMVQFARVFGQPAATSPSGSRRQSAMRPSSTPATIALPSGKDAMAAPPLAETPG